jgi:hypothetical protein
LLLEIADFLSQGFWFCSAARGVVVEFIFGANLHIAQLVVLSDRSVPPSLDGSQFSVGRSQIPAVPFKRFFTLGSMRSFAFAFLHSSLYRVSKSPIFWF